ncbi:Xyloglucan endotransglucosylase/hydrolase [Rhynchospora pubera]|uniref:Xyloglucan endotransglucosylase/hydrolase n=1 Tax=Rhynchospora pubera TaxID=906938 RepID=A0AAV8CWT5_9POAL|nr:Xyloglucan endotransglucosylase/hydrolase [Rhynchospora pubera]
MEMGFSFPCLFFASLLLCIQLSGSIDAPIKSLQTLSFDDGYTQIFGDSNLMLLRDGKTVHLSLDEKTGAGFASQDLYLHGFFSASIKLPADYAAGVVVAFYLSNGDVYHKTHDELDFEFLGNVRGREWRLQTNVYGNGSTRVGREERYDFWFDPTDDFHQYSILWTPHQIIFYIDSTPIREIRNSKAMGSAFPSKPMTLYATIWDGSTWATLGGRYKVNYRYAPFVAEFAALVLHGCTVDPLNPLSSCDEGFDSSSLATTELSVEQRSGMDSVRANHMTYSYCHDRKRYTVPLPECEFDPGTSRLYGDDGLKFGERKHRRGKRSRIDSSF